MTRAALVPLALALLLVSAGGADSSPAARVGHPVDWVSWAPGPTLLFAASDLYSIQKDGRGLRRVVRAASGGSWSPDGRIAFEPDDSRVAVTAPNGSRRLVRRGFGPIWSPAGDRLAYSTRFDLRVMRADGSADRAVVPLPWGQDRFRELGWSPDGRQLVFSQCRRATPQSGYCRDAEQGVGVFTAFVDGPRRLRSVSRGYGHCPDWSRRGRIAFSTSRGVVVANADGSSARLAFARPLRCAVWSPDGRLLAVEGARSLVLTTADGKARWRVAALPPPPRCCGTPAAPAPAWSPDGRRVAVARSVEGPPFAISTRIYVVDVLARRARVIVTTPAVPV
jgi:hypothetical protein